MKADTVSLIGGFLTATGVFGFFIGASILTYLEIHDAYWFPIFILITTMVGMFMILYSTDVREKEEIAMKEWL